MHLSLEISRQLFLFRRAISRNCSSQFAGRPERCVSLLRAVVLRVENQLLRWEEYGSGR
jgi:hypothetical protein